MVPEVRKVTLGTRRATDPVDHFLEEHFLYRKHTLHDASSLFRVVSEQVYDSQVLHYEVRMECVRFMFRKRRIFEAYVPGDYDGYLWEMEKTYTTATTLELSAMCLMYRRNMVLYESFQLGKMVTIGGVHNDREVIRVFKDRNGHFDSVFTQPEIDMAAICQSIAYKLLYTQLFRLPDVSLAVEAMLYPETFSSVQFEMDDKRNVVGLLCPNGRSFKLDRPETTLCLLANYKTCAYHNRECDLNATESPLPISCVRQLLAEEVIPFSYKVCKALDPYTYRNVELYCLNAARRGARNQSVYLGDYNFKVGAKCLVALDPNEPRNMTICYIQRINWKKTSSLVFSPAMAKFLTVPYVALHPIPLSEFQPWDPPYRRRQFWRPKINRMQQQLMPADNRDPTPNRYKTQHSEGRKVTLPFPSAPDNEIKDGNDQMQHPPLPSNQGNPSMFVPPDQRTALAVMPIPRPRLPPVPQPVFYPMPPPAMGPPQIMPGQYPLQPQIIRPPVRFYYISPPPLQGPPGAHPGMMRLPFVANNAPMLANTVNDYQL